MPRCFKCDKAIEAAWVPVTPDQEEGDAWKGPGGATLFEGGFTFGSALYDAPVDGVYVEVIICDECLKQAKLRGEEVMREIKRNPTDFW